MNSDWLTLITNTCQDLLTAKCDGFINFGLSIVTGLAVIRLALFGIGCALNAVDGHHGMDWAGFFRHILVIGTAMTMLRGYNAPVLGLSDSFPKLLMNGPIYLAHEIGDDSYKQIDTVFRNVQQNNPPSPTLSISLALSRWTLEILLAVTQGVLLIVLSYGFIGSAVCALVGPVFIAFLVFEPMSFMFWGWFKTFLQYSFYPVVGAAYTHIFATVLVNVIDPTTTIDTAIVAVIPLLLLTIIGMLHAPQMCASLFTGAGGDHHGMAATALKVAGIK
jgi:type IV secretory pathway VirB6-like protein